MPDFLESGMMIPIIIIRIDIIIRDQIIGAGLAP